MYFYFVKNTDKVFGSFPYPCNKCWYSIIFLPNKIFYVNFHKYALISRTFPFFSLIKFCMTICILINIYVYIYTYIMFIYIHNIVTPDPVYCYDCRTPNRTRRSVFLLLGDESRKCCK